MTGAGVEAWQISLLVTALVVLAEAGINALLRRNVTILVHRRVRTGALAALGVLTVVVFVVALGPSLADELSSVAAAVTAVVALWLTYRSYHSSAGPAPTDPGTPAGPAPTGPEPSARPAPSDAEPTTGRHARRDSAEEKR